MNTHKAIAELARWASAASAGDAEGARQQVQQFYHIGSALVASKDFQIRWKAKHATPLEPRQLEDACRLLELIASVEAAQVQSFGRAAA